MKKNLLQQIAQGDEKAFELLFREHYQGLCYFAMQYLNEYQAAENTVQETFVKIWEKRNELHIKSSVKQYLLNMVKNRCLNYLAHQKVKNEYSQKATDDLSRERIDPSKYFLEVDLAKRIQESIDSLPPRRREIFILCKQEGLKYKEIADRLNISVKTVEVQMGHALKHLRESLDNYRDYFTLFFLLAKK